MPTRVTFLGAAGTVTGSKYLVETESQGRQVRVLVDAGLFQGERPLRERNWEDYSGLGLDRLDACILTHAHVDHCGFLPRLQKLGLQCPVYCTSPTADLASLLLLDSAKLQEEEAAFRARQGRSRHTPPLPLYTSEDAKAAIALLTAVPFGKRVELALGVEAQWTHVGHILGAASVNLFVGNRAITFSGDVGRYGVPILKDPEGVDLGGLLLIESTYGDRLHRDGDQRAELAAAVNGAVERRGALLIPSFAVGRAQLLLYFLRELKERRLIPDVPIVVDSPMAEDATGLYAKHPSDYDEDALKIVGEGRRPFSVSNLSFTRSSDDSRRLNDLRGPIIIISASGMLSGGRILHHLVHRLPRPENTVLFVGHQPPGGKGDWLLKRAPAIRIFNSEVAVRAKILEMSGCSAHADQFELLRWARSCRGRPDRVAVVHGEPSSALTFLKKLKEELGWQGFVPGHRQTIEV